MITDLEPDILECKVEWALGSIITNKASRGDGIPVELFQILKDDAVTKDMPANFKNSEKRSVFILIPKARPNNVQTTTQLHSSHTIGK